MAGTAALGLFRELRTQPVRNRPRTSRRGQVRHRPVAMSPASTGPPWPAHSPRATSVAMHVNPRDALIQHFHARPPPAAAPPTDRDKARRPPGPRSVQETDTRARSSNGGYPARGPGANLTYGLERSKREPVTTSGTPAQLCTFRPARLPGHRQKTPAARDPHPPTARGDPVFASHGSATQWRMNSYLVFARFSADATGPTERRWPG